MKLDQFVSETLKQIIDGVVNAQKHAESQGALVNPITATVSSGGGNNTHIYDSNTGALIEKIEFDVHISVSQESSSTGGGASVGEVTVATGLQTGEQNTSSNRIKFSVPMLLPTSGKEDNPY